MEFIKKESLLVPDYLAQLTDERSLRPYLCKSIAGASAAYDTLNSSPSIDTAAMSVRMRISTDNIDRQGHIVNQKGIVLEAHKMNPVVLFNHGKEYTIPVAMAEVPESEAYTVTVGDHESYAVGYHKAADKMSSQIFDAIVNGLLRACSVGISPIEAYKVFLKDGTEALYLEQVLLNEYTYCAIGINPFALKKSMNCEAAWLQRYEEAWALQCEAANRILTTNRLDGTAILPVLHKSFSALLETNATTRGIGMKKLSSEEIKKLNRAELKKALGCEYKEYDPETQLALAQAASDQMDTSAPGPSDNPATPAIDKSDDAGDGLAVDVTPPGAVVCAAVYSALSDLLGKADPAVAALEKPEVKDGLTEELATIRDSLTRIEGIYAASYSDQPPLAGDAVDPDADVVKSFLSAEPRYGSTLGGVAARLNGLVQKVPAEYRKSLQQSASDLARLMDLSKGFKSKEALDNEALEKKVTSLEQRLNGLMDRLDKTPA